MYEMNTGIRGLLKKTIQVFLIFLFYLSSYSFAAAPSAICAGNISVSNFDIILIIFDQGVEQTTSEAVSNYQVCDSNNNCFGLNDANLSTDVNNCVYLSLSSQMNAGCDYYVRYRNIENLIGELNSSWQNSNTFAFETLATETYEIMLAQFPNGAYNMRFDGVGRTEFEPGDNIWVIPYFGCFAAQSMILANRISPDPNYLQSAKEFLTWYVNNMNPDGTVYDFTGTYPNFVATGDYDSTDSYASEFILTSLMYYQDTEDSNFLDWVWPNIIKAAGAIDLTLQGDGLTWAKPTYHAKYLMDNSEVWQGYTAAAIFAELEANLTRQSEWQNKADNVLAAIESDLYLGDGLSRYAIAKFENDSLDTGWDDTSPDGLAQCLMIKNVLDEVDKARAQAVWGKVKERFIPNGMPADITVPTWWVMSANATGDSNSVYRDICYVKIFQRLKVIPYIELRSTHIFSIYQEAIAKMLSAGDLNGDDGVNMIDFSLLTTKWKSENCDQGNNWCEKADVNKDGGVDFGDIALFVETWLVNRSFWR